MNAVCPICIRNVHKRGKVILQCEHCMHLKCYTECLKFNVIECPLCKRSITENKKYFLFLNKKFNSVVENLKNTFSLEKLFNSLESELSD